MAEIRPTTGEKKKLTREQKKKQMVLNMSASLGNVSASIEPLGLTRQTHYDWMKKDAKYAAAIDDVIERDLDFSEAALRKNIQLGKEASIIFHLKTKGKKRGYIETAHVLNTDLDKSDVKNKSVEELLAILDRKV